MHVPRKLRSTGTGTSTALLVSAVITLAAAGIFAALDWGGTVSSGVFALTVLAIALAVAGLALNVRQVTLRSQRVVTVAVARAPKDAFYRGYSKATADALGGGQRDGDTVDLCNL